MWLFLSGPMGAGKSTAAREAAVSLCRPCYDLDSIIEREAGMSISQFFAERGEPAFRELEARCLLTLVAEQAAGVVALGGGALVRRDSRRLCQRAGTVISLMAEPARLARRLAGDDSRPLLSGGDAEKRLAAVLDARKGVYAEAHAVIDTGSLTIEETVARVVRVSRRPPELVPLGERSYPVFVGLGYRAQLAELLAERLGEHKRIWVTDKNVRSHWGDEIRELSAGTPLVSLEPGEAHKTIEAVNSIWSASLDGGLDRAGAMVAFGGGLVGDLTGFAASSLYRGVSFVGVPTSLLAMVDSSVGGKTGFNREEGKNLIGSFHQPSFVVADVEFLRTLPEAELLSGLGEVAKSAWLAGEDAVAQLEEDASLLRAGEPESLMRAVKMSIGLKSRIVADDELEAGSRAHLNLGHTLGHAFEVGGGYGKLRHGQAVALGMVAAFNLAVKTGALDAAARERGLTLLEKLGLPTDLNGHFSERARAALSFDKKRQGGTIRFVVPGFPGSAHVEAFSVERVWELVQPSLF